MNSTESYQVERISKYYLAKNFTDFDFYKSNNLIIFYGGTRKKKSFYCNQEILNAVVDVVL